MKTNPKTSEQPPSPQPQIPPRSTASTVAQGIGLVLLILLGLGVVAVVAIADFLLSAFSQGVCNPRC